MTWAGQRPRGYQAAEAVDTDAGHYFGDGCEAPHGTAPQQRLPFEDDLPGGTCDSGSCCAARRGDGNARRAARHVPVDVPARVMCVECKQEWPCEDAVVG